jgi:hypothetical protein
MFAMAAAAVALQSARRPPSAMHKNQRSQQRPSSAATDPRNATPRCSKRKVHQKAGNYQQN